MSSNQLRIILFTNDEALSERVRAFFQKMGPSVLGGASVELLTLGIEDVFPEKDGLTADACIFDGCGTSSSRYASILTRIRERFLVPVALVVLPEIENTLPPSVRSRTPCVLRPDSIDISALDSFLKLTSELNNLRTSLTHRLDVEQFLLSFSETLSLPSYGEGFPLLDEALMRLGEYLGAARCDVTRFLPYSDNCVIEHRWDTRGASIFTGSSLQPDFPYRWIISHSLDGEALHYSSLEELPREAALEKTDFSSSGFKAFASVPLTYEEQSIGILILYSDESDFGIQEDQLDYLLKKCAFFLANHIERVNRLLVRREEIGRLRTEIKDAGQRFFYVVESMLQGLIVADEDGRLIFVNSSMSRLTGFEKNEMLGRRLYDFFYPAELRKERPEVQSEFDAYAKDMHERYEIRKKGVAETYRSKIFRKTGEQRIIETRASPLVSSDGSITGSIGIFVDITSRVDLEDRIISNFSAEVLANATKAVISDLSRQLTLINGYANLSTDDESLARVSLHSENACKLLSELAELSQPQSNFLSIKEAIEKFEPVIRSLMGTRIQLSFELGEEELRTKANTSDLMHMLLALFAKSREEIIGEGSVDLICYSITGEETEEFSGHLDPQKRYVAITVADTGQASEDANYKQLLGRSYGNIFSSYAAETGLNLSYVKRIAESYSGALKATSEPKGGHSVTIYLPSAETITADQPKNTGTSVYFLPEDFDPALADLCLELCEEHRIQVQIIDNPETFLHNLELIESGILLAPAETLSTISLALQQSPTPLRVVAISNSAEKYTHQGNDSLQLIILDVPFTAAQFIAALQESSPESFLGGASQAAASRG